MTDAELGIVTAHHFSALHRSPVNKTFVQDFQVAYGKWPNYHAVAGYDGMHLIYEALKRTNGNADGDAPKRFLRCFVARKSDPSAQPRQWILACLDCPVPLWEGIGPEPRHDRWATNEAETTWPRLPSTF